MNYPRGMFALSADPITYGHLAIIARAAAQCDALVVLIAQNDAKRGSYLFTLEERRAIAEKALALAGLSNVSVIASDGNLGDLFLQHGCDVLFRGIRGERDRIEERELVGAYQTVWPLLKGKIEFLESAPDLAFVSSGMVKLCASRHLPVSDFTPLFVQELLDERLCLQWKIGVTGEIGSGKSFVSRQVMAEIKETCAYPVHHINLDALIRQVYAEASHGSQQLRTEIVELLGPEMGTSDELNLDALKQTLLSPFSNACLRRKVEEMTRPHVERVYREALCGVEGLVLVEWAQLAEMGINPWTNNNVIVVSNPHRYQMAMERGVSEEQYAFCSAIQLSADEKEMKLRALAKADGHGTVIRYTNRLVGANIPHLVEEIFQALPGIRRAYQKV